MTDRRRWLVHGRVQGVFYRQTTLEMARTLGSLEGYVRNLPDGTVEVEARGSSRSLQDLLTFLEEGPPAARVDRVEEVPPQAKEDLGAFQVR